MKDFLMKPIFAVAAGLALILPGALMITLLTLHIEPPLARLLPAPASGPHVAGTLAALILIVVLPAAALALNFRAAKASLAGGRVSALRSVHFWLAAAALLVLAVFIGAVIVDQYPCWLGVPNCD